MFNKVLLSLLILPIISSFSHPLSGCLTYHRVNPANCSQCSDGYTLLEGKCFFECKTGEFLNSPAQTCEPCSPNCLNGCIEAIANEGQRITVCQPTSRSLKKFDYDVSLQNKTCPKGCITCLDNGYCTSCESEYSLENGSCQQKLWPVLWKSILLLLGLGFLAVVCFIFCLSSIFYGFVSCPPLKWLFAQFRAIILAFYFVDPIFEEEKVPEPDAKFAPESDAKKEYYVKLAAIARKKARLTYLSLLVVAISIAALSWTSGTTIYYCFKGDSTAPSGFKEIDISICKKANNDKLTVTRTWNWALLSDTYLQIAVICLGMSFIFFFISYCAEISIKFLAYGVKVNCYSLFPPIYLMVGAIFGVGLWETVDQSLKQLTYYEQQLLYYWGSPNYPETFMSYSVQFLKTLTLSAGIIKILLAATRDPLDFFCSLGNMIEVRSNFDDDGIHVPVPKYTTDIQPVIEAKINSWVISKVFKAKKDIDRDILSLTILDEQKLVFRHNGKVSEQIGLIQKVRNYIGFKGLGLEKKVKDLASKTHLSPEAWVELTEAHNNLSLYVTTKAWPQILLFCTTLLTAVAGRKFVKDGSLDEPSWTTWIYGAFLAGQMCNIIIITKYITWTLSWVFCALALGGSCIEAVLITVNMIAILKSDGNYYILAPFMIIGICGIQLLALLKMFMIVHTAQKAKNVLSKNKPINPPLALGVSGTNELSIPFGTAGSK